MNVDNLMPVLIINIYLIIIFLIIYYKNKLVHANNKKSEINLDNYNKTLLFYLYNNNTLKSLFNLTLLDLIDKGYFKLENNKGNIYIKKTNRVHGDLLKHEKLIYDYIEKKLDNAKELKELDYKIKGDLSISKILSKYYKYLKEESKKTFGNLDFYSGNFLALVLGIPYFMQIIFFIYNKISLEQNIFLSIGLILVTIVLSDKIKNRKKDKNELLFLILYFISAYIACFIWINNSNFNYIIFHVILGLISFMYPVFLKIIIYATNTNSFCFNNLQMKILEEMNENKGSKDPIFVKGFKKEYNENDKNLKEFNKIFN